MASKALVLLLASFLLVSTVVSSQLDEEVFHEFTIAPFHSTPPPSPPLKASPPPAPVKVLPPPPPPMKATPPHPPVVVLPPPPPTTPAPKTKLGCEPLCAERCKLHSRKRVCMRACLTCCGRCKCVPPGQYGNKEKCGKCYADMTTRGGRPKCP